MERHPALLEIDCYAGYADELRARLKEARRADVISTVAVFVFGFIATGAAVFGYLFL